MAYTNKFQQPDGGFVNIADFRNAGVYYGTCATAASTAAKVVSVTDARGSAFFELTSGAIIFVKFTYANTVQSAISLNVNSTGAKTVKYKNLTTKAPVWNAANETIGFTYDGSNFITIDPFEVGATISYGQVDSTSTATAFTATVPGITELTDGVTVMLKNGVVTSAAGFTININGLGAKPVYSNMATGNSVTPTAPTQETTIFNINYTLLLIYSSTIVSGGGWINYRGYDSNTNTLAYQIYRERNNGVMVNALYRYQIVFTQKDGKFMAANTTSNSTATSKTLSTLAFDPFQPIFYYGSTTDVAAAATPDATYLYEQRYDVDLRYAFNAGKTLTANKAVYIKCSPQADGTVKFSGNACITQTLPSTADGYVYLYLGKSYSTYQIVLDIYHPIYEYKNGRLGLWTNIEAGSTVSITPTLSSGTQIATYTIGSTSGTLYAPSSGLPSVTSADNGKVLRVVDGAWAAATVPDANGVSF
jgi:hypothetical protein